MSEQMIRPKNYNFHHKAEFFRQSKVKIFTNLNVANFCKKILGVLVLTYVKTKIMRTANNAH